MILVLVSTNMNSVESWPVTNEEQIADAKLNLLTRLIAMRNENDDDDDEDAENGWSLDEDLLQRHADKRSRQRFGETRSRVKELNNQHPVELDNEQQGRLKNIYEKLKVANHLHN